MWEIPLLMARLGWAREHLAQLVGRDFVVITEDLKVGLVMTNEFGICHKVQRAENPDAVQWVLGIWGFKGDR